MQRRAFGSDPAMRFRFPDGRRADAEPARGHRAHRAQERLAPEEARQPQRTGERVALGEERVGGGEVPGCEMVGDEAGETAELERGLAFGACELDQRLVDGDAFARMREVAERGSDGHRDLEARASVLRVGDEPQRLSSHREARLLDERRG
jgi:hypothetical protein